MRKKSTNTLFHIAKTRYWMLDPMSASSALALYHDMVGAARLKAKYPIVEYDETDDEDVVENNSYYHFKLTHKDCPAIPQGSLVSVVRLEGVMMRDGDICQYGTRDVAAWLLEGDKDRRVLGNILIVDSGGGAADSVRDLADAIQACNNPVVAYCDGYMCSAAYYAASYCGSIMAHDRRNMVGCIGTMIELGGYPMKSVDEDGFVRLRIYADGSEEKNSDYEKALEGDVKPIRENLLNPLAEDFRNDVKANRPTATDDQLKGRTYFAQDVVGTLIDSIGTLNDAVAKTLELSNSKITEMQGFEALQSLSTCHDLQMVDGHVTLDGEQLNEINAALAAVETERALANTHGETVAEQLTTINEQTEQIRQLTEENENLQNTVTERDNTISELRTQLAESNHDTEENHLPAHNGNHAPSDEEDDGLSPMEYAKKHEELYHS